jgi:hypothetical protein
MDTSVSLLERTGQKPAPLTAAGEGPLGHRALAVSWGANEARWHRRPGAGAGDLSRVGARPGAASHAAPGRSAGGHFPLCPVTGGAGA